MPAVATALARAAEYRLPGRITHTVCGVGFWRRWTASFRRGAPLATARRRRNGSNTRRSDPPSDPTVGWVSEA